MKRWGIGRQDLAETAGAAGRPGPLVPSVALSQSTDVTNALREWLADIKYLTVFKISKINLQLKTFPERLRTV